MAGPPSPSNPPGAPKRGSGPARGRSYSPPRSHERRPASQQPAASSGCFPGDALVLTPAGYRPIKQFIVGDEVSSWRVTSNTLVTRRVTGVLEHSLERIWTIEFDCDRHPLRTTSFHTLLTARGWSRVDRLTIGDQLISVGAHLTTSKVTAIAASNMAELVYNLHTSFEHNYVVEPPIAPGDIGDDKAAEW